MAETATLRPFREIPRGGGLDFLWTLLTGRERIDMRFGLQRLEAQHGPIVVRRTGIFNLLYLFGPDANRFVLLDRERVFSARRPWMMIMGKIFPNGLLLMDGDLHKQHRKIMHAAFTRTALRQYLADMQPMITAGLAGWGQQAGALQAFRSYKTLTLNVAASIFVGEPLGPQTAQMNDVFEDMVAASMSKLRLPVPGTEFYRGWRGRRFLIEYFGERIRARRAAEGDDMFSRLCRATSEDGDQFTDQEIIDHMIFLMMAAHDTTTSTLTSMTYELARHPEWQERLRDESVGRGAYLDFDDLERLTGLTMVMKETLRLYPPLPVIPRITTAPVSFGGYEIPADSMVVIAPIHTHYMEEWWSEPLRFDPSRFAPERAEDERHTHSWIPFGGGPHLCIGMRFADLQVKAVMHQLLQRYRWRVPDGYRMPVQQAPISKPLDGLPIEIEPLRSSAR